MTCPFRFLLKVVKPYKSESSHVALLNVHYYFHLNESQSQRLVNPAGIVVLQPRLNEKQELFYEYQTVTKGTSKIGLMI